MGPFFVVEYFLMMALLMRARRRMARLMKAPEPYPITKNKGSHIMSCPTCEHLLCSDLKAHYLPIQGKGNIELSAAEGCPGCSLILNSFLAFYPRSRFDPFYDLIGLEIGQPASGPGPLRLRVYQQSKDHIKGYPPTMGRYGRHPVVEIFTTSAAGKVHSFPEIGQGFPVPENTGCEQTLQQLRGWFQECRGRHPNCKREGGRLPRRVIDIGGVDKVPRVIRLYEPIDEKGDYICLSYRWPREPSMQSLRSNIEAHKVNIPFDNFPLAFQQAFRVAQALGVQYVWIDAICIIQDDEDDKSANIAVMDSIYESSALTIMSAWWRDPRCGLFAPRADWVKHREFQVTGNDGLQQTVFARNYYTHHFFDENIFHRPGEPCHYEIFDRAWIYQERILSPRAVYFVDGEIIWDCGGALWCQCRAPYEMATWSARRGTTIKYQHPRSGPQLRWKYIEEYSALELTNPADKLKAIQGLAVRMQTKWGRKSYLAGLWEDTLLTDLCWHSVGPSRFRRRPKPKVWRAPTWSWACHDSAVQNIVDDGIAIRPYARIIQVETSPASPRASDSILRGEITLHTTVVDSWLNRWCGGYTLRVGMLTPDVYVDVYMKNSRPEKTLRVYPRPSAEKSWCSLDCRLPKYDCFEGNHMKILCARILEYQDREGYTKEVSLVIRKVEVAERDLYERIGVLLYVVSGIIHLPGDDFGDDHRLLRYGREEVVCLQ